MSVSTSVPQLKDYGLNETYGFLGEEPLKRLSDEHFAPWEKTLDQLSHLLVAWKLREHVQQHVCHIHCSDTLYN